VLSCNLENSIFANHTTIKQKVEVGGLAPTFCHHVPGRVLVLYTCTYTQVMVSGPNDRIVERMQLA
jgi:hypothetical protein